MPKDSCCDEELVSQYLAGDGSALDKLLERYQKLLWQYICQLIHSSDDPTIEDILQEVMLTAFRDIRAFQSKGPGSFKAWLWGIAHNRARQAIAKLKRQPEPFSVRFPKSLPEDVEAERPDTTDDEESQNLLTNKLNLLLSGLEPADQRIFELKRQGLTYQEILQQDEFKGWTPGKLRIRFYRIMEMLRDKTA